MNKTSFKWTMYLLLISLTFPIASALTPDQLINLYDQSTNRSIMWVTSISDTMIDTNSNGQNDTLQITVNTQGTSAAYSFAIELEDINTTITKTIDKIVSTTDTLLFNFSTGLLKGNIFNYSLRIFNSTDDLLFRNNQTQTKSYPVYENGSKLLSISDQNINNDLIRINLQLNNPQNTTQNVTVVLQYNSSTIFAVEEKSLTSGIQNISIDVNNETIKSSHYKGNYTITSIAIGDLNIPLNYTTNEYDYETFAKTSYIKNIISSPEDINANNLSENLYLNVTLNIKQPDTYTIDLQLYDLFDNFVINASNTTSLSTGIQTIPITLNGSEIYKTRIVGPYRVKLATLTNTTNVTDTVLDYHTTSNYAYTSFEPPPRPDLIINIINVTYTQNITRVLINTSNQGKAPAFNVFIDIFDNNTFSYNQSFNQIDQGQYFISEVNNSNTTEHLYYIAIVDFDNIVDEENENNNLATTLEALPTQDTPILNATDHPLNRSDANLTVYNRSTSDGSKNIIDWRQNGTSITILNMPFESHKYNASITIDYSTFNNQGTVSGALFNNSIGYDRKAAYEFTGTNTGIIIPNINASNYTITAWIKPDQVNNYENLFYWQGSATYFAITNGICAYTTAWSCTGTAPVIGTWFHLGITSQGKVYKNGLYMGTITVEPVAGNLSIGDRDGTTWDFDGIIDEVQIYNRVLSAEQIQALYRNETNTLVSQETNPNDVWSASITPNDGQNGETKVSNNIFINYEEQPPTHNIPLLLSSNYLNTSNANLTVYNQSTNDVNNDQVKNIIDWRLNNNSIALLNLPFEKTTSYTTIAKDYSTNNKNGTVSGAVFNQSGGYDKRAAYSFDGIDDYISTTLIYTSNNISVGGWYKSNDNITTKMTMIGGNNGGRFEVYVNQGYPGCRVWDTAEHSIYAPEPVNNGWHHIVCTQTYNPNSSKLYVDGTLAASTNYNSISAGGYWYVGKPGSIGAKYFNGTIDEVFIINRSLSPEQIKLLYRNQTNIILSNETTKGDAWTSAITPHDGKGEGQTKVSNTLEIVNAAPYIPQLLTWQNNTHTNDNTTTFTWQAVQDPDDDNVQYEFVLSNTSNFIIVNQTNISTLNYTLIQQLNDSIYYWKVRSCDNNKCGNYSQPFMVVIDTINPNIQWIYPDSTNTSKNYEHNITWNIKISDTNLYNVLLNVTNASGNVMYTEYISNISVTTYNFTNVTDITNWPKGTYTVEVSAGDDHTYGSLHDLTYTIKSDGILFTDGKTNKKISVGYIAGNNYIFAQPSDIQSNNIVFNAREINKEYKWEMNIKRPQIDMQVGFAIPAKDVILRDKEKAHFVWDNWYIDFEDLVSNGFPINIKKQVINNQDYWIVSTSTGYCKEQTCTLDPVVGGLNIVTEYKSIYLNKKPIHNPPILNATDAPVNSDNANLTSYPQNTVELDGEAVKNIYDWRLNGNSIALLNLPFETSTKDYSTNNKNGTVNGATFNLTGGIDNFSSYDFDGNDYITTSLNYNSGINITISAWYKTNDNLTTKMTVIGGNSGGRFEMYVHQGFPGCRVWDTGERSIYASQQFIGSWHHIACTQTFFPNTTSLYVDGILQSTTNYSSLSAGGTWKIGYPGSSGAKYFNGTIDEVMIVNRSLSSEQIKVLTQRNDLLVSQETNQGDQWQTAITPHDKTSEGTTKISNTVNVLGKNVWNGTSYLYTCSIAINNTDSINHIYEPQTIDPTSNCNFTNSLQSDRDDLRLVYKNITEIPIAAETDANYIIALLNATANNADANYTLFWGNGEVNRTDYSNCSANKPCTYELRGDLFKAHDRFDNPATGYNNTFWNVQTGNCGVTTLHVYEGLYAGNCTNGGILYVDIPAPNTDPTYSGAMLYDEGDTAGSNGNAFMDTSSGESMTNGAGERTEIHSSKYVYTNETGGWSNTSFNRYTGWKAVNMKSTFASKELYFNTTLIGNITQTSAANDPSEIVRYKIGIPTTSLTNTAYFDFFAYGKNEFHLYDMKARIVVGDKG